MGQFNQTTLNKYARSVSIIGVGLTPFMYTVDNDETNGLSEGELYGYAALKAMEDAGVTPKDVQYYYHGEASPLNGSDYLTPNVQIANWFGMKGKGSMHHSEACNTGYLALEIAVNAVASGKYDCVLTGCVEFGDGVCIPTHPWKREKMSMDRFNSTLAWLYDRAYNRSFVAGTQLIFDNTAERYKREAGLTDQEMDDTLIHMSLNNRKNALHHPLALMKKSYEEEAKEQGFDDVMEYMRSPYNPKVGDLLRVSGMEMKCDGAACAIICATDKVEEITKGKCKKPIEILGIGSAAVEASNPHFEWKATELACEQVYQQTGVKPEEIDLFFANDFIITSHLMAAEVAGYLPKNEGWKYIIEGRTAFDGDKPINTNGGRTSFGHAHAASGLADVHEAVTQMRGEAGDRQVKKLPKTTFLRGYGGGQNVASIILRTVE